MLAIKESVLAYCEDITSGRISCCKLHRQSVDRFLRDLERQGAADFPYVLNWDRARIYAESAQYLHHIEGAWRGQPFILEPFQLFIDANLFGWVHDATGYRRFNEAYIKLSRKSGKTFYAASVGVRMGYFDGEGAPQLITAATKMDQAMLGFKMMARMYRDSSAFGECVTVQTREVRLDFNDGIVKPLANDSKSLDGLNLHFGLIDEIHAHKNSDLADVLRSSTGARTQPLLLLITSGGTTSGGFDEKMMEAASLILDPLHELTDEQTFYFVTGLDPEDDWKDESLWAKANPNIGVTVPLDYYRKQFKKVLSGSMSEEEFRTKYLGQTVEGGARWIENELWDACTEKKIDYHALSRKVAPLCAIDLSKNRDLSAFSFLWTLPDGRDYYQAFYFAPAGRCIARERANDQQYAEWAAQKRIILTGEDELDYGILLKVLLKQMRAYGCHDIGYDQRYAWDIMAKVADAGFNVHKLPVTRYDQMTTPCERFYQSVTSRTLRHDGHPILRWNVGNMVKRYQSSHTDTLYLPDKASSTRKIDGAVCCIYCKFMAMCDEIITGPSAYDENDLMIV